MYVSWGWGRKLALMFTNTWMENLLETIVLCTFDGTTHTLLSLHCSPSDCGLIYDKKIRLSPDTVAAVISPPSKNKRDKGGRTVPVNLPSSKTPV